MNKALPEQRSVSCIVTLLHGTFQPRAGWTRKHSKLYQRLLSTFPKETRITRVVWSGRNTFAAREQAAVRLRKRLQRQAIYYPDAQQIVVAHSHGGNVALLAIKEAETRKRLSGIACLATPFLHVVERNLGPGGRNAVLAALLMLVLVVCLVTGQVIGKRYLPGVWPFLLYWPVFLVVAFGLLKAFKLWEAIAERTKDQITLGEFDPDQLLLLRMSGDEASTGLGAMQLVSSAMTKVYAKLDSIEESAQQKDESMMSQSRIYAWALRLLTVLVVGVFLAGLLQPFDWFNNRTRAALGWASALKAEWPNLYIGSWLVILLSMIFCFYWLGRYRMAYLAVAAIRAVSLPIVAVMVAVLALPFGPELAAASIFLEITAEAQPPGRSPPGYLFLPRYSNSADGRRPGLLVHSAVYEDDRALDALCTWIQERIARPKTRQV